MAQGRAITIAPHEQVLSTILRSERGGVRATLTMCAQRSGSRTRRWPGLMTPTGSRGAPKLTARV